MNCVMFCTFFNNLYGRIQLRGVVSRNGIFRDTCYLRGIAEVGCLAAAGTPQHPFLSGCSTPVEGNCLCALDAHELF